MENSSRSTLVKILELEQKLGYRDTAVMGGLDKFVTRWADSFSGLHPDFTQAAGLDLEIEQDLKVVSSLKYYRQSSIEERKTKVEKALRLLHGETARITPNPMADTASTRSAPTWDSLPSASKASSNALSDFLWQIVILVGLPALYIYGLVSNVVLLKVALAILLAYIIYRFITDPLESRPGQKVVGMHGIILSARYAEKSNRQGCLIWCIIAFITILASILRP